MGKFSDSLKKIFEYKNDSSYEFILTESNTHKDDFQETNQNVFSNYNDNYNYVKTRYSTMINSDIKIREFSLNYNNKTISAFILFIDGMIDSISINQFLLQPLMNINNKSKDSNSESKKISIINSDNLETDVMNTIMPQCDVKPSTKFSEIFSQVNSGVTALFIDTIPKFFLIDAKGFEKRSINPPENEYAIRGSQEAFIESIRTNTSILRRLINNENLIIESTSVGKISRTQCCICYIKNIANENLVSEVKFRINNLSIDSITSSGELEQFISDKSYGIPQMIATERPDRVAGYILGGRVAILVNGTPYVLIAPGVFTDFLEASEDRNIHYQFANLLKLIRILSLIITVILPGFYIAVTTFHQEIIPTELLFAIVASRNTIPFPIIIEILVMDVSLELIRESGIRVPSPIGQTIGIVGGLILGDAAVTANIVSPILIIIVAITGLTSFAIPDYSLGFHLRIARAIYLLAGYFAGLLGIAVVIFLHLGLLASINTFGVSFLSPYAPFSANNNSSFLLSPIWKREERDSFLKTERASREDFISMNWKKGSE